MTVNLKLFDNSIIYENLKAIIDTGASRSAVNESIIQKDIDLTSLEPKSGYGAGGIYEARYVNSVGVSINQLLPTETYIPLEKIGTVKMANDYDFIIGNDILYMCEFIYSAYLGKFELKIYQE